MLEAGYKVTIMDNFHNSCREAFNRIQRLAGERAKWVSLEEVDLRDKEGMDKLFSAQKFDAVIHFAGLKAVGESMQIPLQYYENNVVGTNYLMSVMAKHGCKVMVFSSSCTVYGNPESAPLKEDLPRNALSAYGRTKLFIEDMMFDTAKSDKEWRIILLRYFNPVGAHPSGLMGEHPTGVPANLMPFVTQVALGIRPELSVFGHDYDTRDGTCIRDFIHVMDLGEAHIYAVDKVLTTPEYGCKAINVGTGKGTSVLEMINTFEEVSGVKVPHKLVGRREGDVIAVWAATDYAESELGWKSKYGLEEMCRDQWNWAQKNPKGYEC